MKNYKLAIVVSGGGTNCSYSVGALCALEKKYKDLSPYVVLGTSGGAGIAAYFVANQSDDNLYIWSNLLSTYKFISFFRFWKIINVDYLIDEVFKKKRGLNIEKIRDSNIKLVISATNVETGKAEYFSNQDNILKALKASKALPIMYNGLIDINGRKYIDGAFASGLNDDIRKAISLGAQKVLVINVSKLDNNLIIKMGKLVLRLSTYFFNNNLKVTVLNFLNESLEKEDHAVPTFYLRPNKLPTNMVDRNKGRLQKSISIGYNDVINNKQLENFLAF